MDKSCGETSSIGFMSKYDASSLQGFPQTHATRIKVFSKIFMVNNSFQSYILRYSLIYASFSKSIPPNVQEATYNSMDINLNFL